MRFPEQVRSSPDAIGNLVLTSSTAAFVPLSQVARIRTHLGESTITRWMKAVGDPVDAREGCGEGIVCDVNELAVVGELDTFVDAEQMR